MVERLASVLGSEARSHPDRLSARRSRLLPGLFFGQAFGDGRRSVTDLGGSTGFGERTDPELDRATTARYHAILQSVIDRLVKVFDTACTGKAAQLVTVLGSPGMGKTRLSRELCTQVASNAGAITFETRCDLADLFSDDQWPELSPSSTPGPKNRAGHAAGETQRHISRGQSGFGLV